MLCLAIMICFGKTAYAETGVDGFIFPSPEEQLNEMEEQGYSDEEIAIAQSKLYTNYPSDFGNKNARVILSLGVTVYKQELWYYCTPAAMRSILKYLNPNFSKSQDNIALAIGTNSTIGGTNDLATVRSYLNANQSENIYVFKTKSTLSTYKGDTYTAISTYSAPMLTNISTSIGATNWPYYENLGTSGHTVVTYGISSDMYTSYIGDPIAGTNFDNLPNLSNIPQKYPVTSSTVYDCLLGYMY